ncbi:Mut7-C RNAse domain-containing protein [Candidatus Latescibacterota bacterium]
MKVAYFRFYEELNDFLPKHRRKVQFTYEFNGTPSIKDAIEAIGVPHSEVDMILINSETVTFSSHLNGGDMVSVYPMFESLDVTTATALRGRPLRRPSFILDVHLGKLASYLRMIGIDTLYKNDYDDEEIIRISVEQHRTILTRDVGLLKHGAVSHGYWIRSSSPGGQLQEVIRRFDLILGLKPFSRCLVCNGIVEETQKADINEELDPMTLRIYDQFYRCSDCGKVYWKGSHYDKMLKFIENLMNNPDKSVHDNRKQ